MTAQIFLMRLCYSRKLFVRAYPNQKQEAFFDGHVRSFHHIEGVPRRITSFTYAQLSGTLQISFIDVGQGDSILMSTSGDTRVLVDAGQHWAGPTIVAYLQAEGIEHIDVVVMSHGHAEHIGGLIELFRSDISVGSVVYNGQPCTTATCATVWAEMVKRSLTPTPAVAGQTHTWGELDVEILNPQPTPRADRNEDSVVKIVWFGETRFLFTGDIGTFTRPPSCLRGCQWKRMLSRPPLIVVGTAPAATSWRRSALRLPLDPWCRRDARHRQSTVEILEE